MIQTDVLVSVSRETAVALESEILGNTIRSSSLVEGGGITRPHWSMGWSSRKFGSNWDFCVSTFSGLCYSSRWRFQSGASIGLAAGLGLIIRDST